MLRDLPLNSERPSRDSPLSPHLNFFASSDSYVAVDIIDCFEKFQRFVDPRYERAVHKSVDTATFDRGTVVLSGQDGLKFSKNRNFISNSSLRS